MRRSLLILLLGALLGLHATPVAAQEGTPTQFNPERAAPQWADMPDAIGYATWVVPQCGAGIDANPGPPPTVTWSEPSSLVAWLAYNWQRTTLGLLCWIAAFTQHVVNFGALAMNLIIGALNTLWRLGLFVWLYGSWLAVEWGTYLYEVQRELLWDLRDGWQIVANWFAQLAQAGADVLAFVGQWITLLGQVVMAGLGWLGWLGGLIMTAAYEMVRALGWLPGGQGPTVGVPDALAGTYPLYCGVRGVVDGLHASQIGWALTVMYAMAYIGWFLWLSRFLSASKAGSQ
jgi:hypothetical protein